MKTAIKVGVAIIVALVAYMLFVVYSMTWSERFLRPVHKGMSQAEVRQLVGAPLKVVTRTNGTDAWYFTQSWFTDAVVYFDTNGLVSAVETD
jgi:hypothetical protein